MPDKDGDDEKTTKGVVKKKTKQMLNQEYIPEEEYDRYRDNILMRGGDHRSKETRERSYTPTGKQPKGDTPMQKEFKKKYGKKATALDAVKQKYKGQIMNVGKKSKKKANEELDLTKIAEAFGGYIIEKEVITGSGSNDPQKNKRKQTSKEIQQRSIKNQDEKNQARRLTQGAGGQKNIGSGKGAERVTGGSEQQKISTYQNIIKNIYDAPSGVRSDMAGDKIADPKNVEKITQTTQTPKDLKGKEIANPLFQKIDQASLTGTGSESRSKADRSDEARKSYNKLQQDKRRLEAQDRMAQRKGFVDYDDMIQQRKKDKPKVGRPVGRKSGPRGDRAERDPEIAAMTPGQKERNIRQIKKDIDSRSPTIDTEVGKVPYRNRRVTKIRSLVPQYDRTPDIMKPDTDELLKFKDFRKKTKTTTMGIDKEQEFKAPEIPKPTVYVPPKPETETETETETQTTVGGDGGKKPPKVSTSTGATGGGKEPSLVSKIAKFSKENPATALLSLDALRRFMPSSSPFGVSGGRVGRRSAPS